MLQTHGSVLEATVIDVHDVIAIRCCPRLVEAGLRRQAQILQQQRSLRRADSKVTGRPLPGWVPPPTRFIRSKLALLALLILDSRRAWR